MEKQKSGCSVIDGLLGGGYETDTITIIYGPGGSGKTNLCILACQSCVNSGLKVIYIDTEGGFSVERLRQVSDDAAHVLKNTFFLRPTSFAGQKRSIQKIKELEDEKIGLVIIDTIAMLYRLEIGKSSRIYDINRELGRQILMLNRIARVKNIPVILTNQVYSDMKNKDEVVMVGGDLLRYQSKCIIELKKLDNGERTAVLRKHRSLPEGRSARFRIIQGGIEKA